MQVCLHSIQDPVKMSYKGKERASDEDEMEEGEQQDNHLSRSRSKSESAVGEGHVEPQSIYNEDLEPQRTLQRVRE